MNWRSYQTSGDSANAIVPWVFQIVVVASWEVGAFFLGGISIGLKESVRKPYQHLPVGVPTFHPKLDGELTP